jgi:hypothetical protein
MMFRGSMTTTIGRNLSRDVRRNKRAMLAARTPVAASRTGFQ